MPDDMIVQPATTPVPVSPAPIDTVTPPPSSAPIAPVVITKPLTVQPPQPTPAVEHAISLDQFGIEHSHHEKRVELLNAFIFSERLAGHHKDTKANYLSRFEAFIHHPA